MQFHNNIFSGVWKSPLVLSPFIQDFNINATPSPPPGDEFWVENATHQQMVTPSGEFYVFQV